MYPVASLLAGSMEAAAWLVMLGAPCRGTDIVPAGMECNDDLSGLVPGLVTGLDDETPGDVTGVMEGVMQSCHACGTGLLGAPTIPPSPPPVLPRPVPAPTLAPGPGGKERAGGVRGGLLNDG